MSVLPTFTRRQQQVLALMRQGMPTRLIAEELGVTIHTVKHHRGLILKNMGVDNTVALIHALQQAERSVVPVRETDAAQPPAVLVVEDDDTTRSLVVSGLQMAGFDCRGVVDGEAMRAALSTAGAHIVVLDLNLGDEDGLKLALELRENQPFIGIVVMTVRGMVEQRIEGLLVGADTYLVKPVDIRELVGVIRNLHRRQAEARAMAAR